MKRDPAGELYGICANSAERCVPLAGVGHDGFRHASRAAHELHTLARFAYVGLDRV